MQKCQFCHSPHRSHQFDMPVFQPMHARVYLNFRIWVDPSKKYLITHQYNSRRLLYIIDKLFAINHLV